jgi:ABC-type nitrate/sulfonate/bicarbonate transport system substrate-binding protein
MRRCRLAGALLLAAVPAMLPAARPGLAETAAVRVVRPIDLTALPLLVMQHEHLIERTAEAMGAGEVTVNWQAPGKAEPLAALAAGEADVAMADLVPFLIAADSGAGTPAELRAVAAVAQSPYILLTRNKAIHTIRDFAEADRIAVPALTLSAPAVMLEMAAAQEWGFADYGQLDRLTVALPDEAAATALMSGKGEIDAHFSRTPYADIELGDPAIHRVMDSFDIAGRHTIAVLVATMGFEAKHPELCKAILSALQAADDYITANPGAASEIFAATDKEEDIPLEDLSDMIGDPDLAYRAAPAGITRLTRFMQEIGRLKRRPTTWRELFLPESRDLPGN